MKKIFLFAAFPMVAAMASCGGAEGETEETVDNTDSIEVVEDEDVSELAFDGVEK